MLADRGFEGEGQRRCCLRDEFGASYCDPPNLHLPFLIAWFLQVNERERLARPTTMYLRFSVPLNLRIINLPRRNPPEPRPLPAACSGRYATSSSPKKTVALPLDNAYQNKYSRTKAVCPRWEGGDLGSRRSQPSPPGRHPRPGRSLRSPRAPPCHRVADPHTRRDHASRSRFPNDRIPHTRTRFPSPRIGRGGRG